MIKLLDYYADNRIVISSANFLHGAVVVAADLC